MKILVLILTAFVFVNVQSHSPKYEMLFKYRADVRTGVINSEIPGSQFVLYADLHGQFHPDSRLSVLFFSNTKVSIYNGEIPMKGEQPNENFLPISESATDFENPFLIGGQGEENKIFTNKNEPQWIINIKKSVASLFQFDWETFENNKNRTSSHTFTVEEDTQYGKCLVTYSMTPQENNWIVKKNQDSKHCSNFNQWASGVEESSCNNGFEDDDDYVTENLRIYEVADSNKNEHFYRFFNKIQAENKILIFPLRPNGNLKYANLKQTIKWVKQKSITKINFENMVPHSVILSFNEFKESDLLEVTTVTFKESVLDNSTNSKFENCKIAVAALSKNLSDVDMYNYVIRQLRYFNAEEFEKFVKTIDSEIIEIFHKIIPMVGTRASANFIKHIVKTDKIKSDVAIQMLQFFPFHIIVPTEKLLEDLKEFLELNLETNSSTKSTAILAYGNLIYRIFKSNPGSSVLEQYIKIYYNNLKTSETFADQLMWLQGLSNIQIGSVWELLIPIIRGDQILDHKYNIDLGFHAIWSAYYLVKEHKTEFYEVLWPMITNTSLDTDIRVTAMKVYLHGSQTKSDLSSLFWEMQKEQNPHVYKYFKTSMEEIVKSTNHCKSPIFNYAKQLKKYMKNYGSGTSSSVYQYENYNSDLGMGVKFYGEEIGNLMDNGRTSNYIEVDIYVMRKSINLLSVYNEYYELSNDTDTKEDFIVRMYDKIIYTNIRVDAYKSSYFSNLFKANDVNFINFIDLFNMNKIIPTDMGLPIVFNTKMPLVTGFKYEKKEGIKNTVSLELQQNLLGNYGTTIYNPFSNVYHGIMSEIRYNINLPISIETNNNTFKFRPDEYKEENIIKFEHGVNSYVFISHESNLDVLLDSCKNCTFFNLVSDSSVKKYKNIDNTIHLSDIGLDYKNYISECLHDSHKFDSLNSGLEIIFSTSLDQDSTYILKYLSNQLPKLLACNRKLTITSSELYPKKEISVSQTSHGYWLNITTPDEIESIKWSGTIKKQADIPNWIGQFSRKVEGKPILNFCYYFKKEYNNDDSYKGEFEFYQGYSYQKECVKNDVVLKMSFGGKQSKEQINALTDDTNTYKSCQHNTKYLSLPSTISLNCMIDLTSLRSFSYNIQYNNLPEYYGTVFASLWDQIKKSNNYETRYEPKTSSKQNEITIDVTYPMNAEDYLGVFDIYLPGTTYTMKTTNYLLDYWHKNENYIFVYFFAQCVLKLNDDVIADVHGKQVKLPKKNEWFEWISEEDNDIKLDIKSIDDKYFSLRLIKDNHTMIVSPKENDETIFTYEMDQDFWQLMTGNNKFGLKMIKYKNSLIFISTNFPYYLIFNPKYVASTKFWERKGICAEPLE